MRSLLPPDFSSNGVCLPIHHVQFPGALTPEHLLTDLDINGRIVPINVDPSTPLLWVIREQLGLTGTKFGCGIAQCGACTIHLNGVAVRSCVTPVSAAVGARLTTIEGIGTEQQLHPVQQAWIDEQVPQCGYCQSGQIMSAVALLAVNPSPDEATINESMQGNLCRCGMYGRIRKAIQRVSVPSVRLSGDAVGIHEPSPSVLRESQHG